MSDRLNAIEAGANAYYEWATIGEHDEPSRWAEDSPSGETARNYARTRAEVIIDAAFPHLDCAERWEGIADQLAAELEHQVGTPGWRPGAFRAALAAYHAEKGTP